jgi:ankyrin repeat protein
LLNRGCAIDIQDKDGFTALMCAAHNDHLPIAELLLNRGCAIDIQTTEGSTALICAACNDHLPIAELLLNRGCAIDIQDKDGFTALMCAAYNGHTDVARVLLVRGADLTLIGSQIFDYGSTGRRRVCRRDALGWANSEGHTAIVELIKREGCWRRRRNWMMFSSMFKGSLRTSTAPIDSSLVEVYNALAMDEITTFIAKML